MQSGPLRGRKEPMARALFVVRTACERGSNGVVLVTGPSGIGKTALVGQVCTQADQMKLRVATGKCDQIGQLRPAAPLVAMLRAGRDPLISSAESDAVARMVGEPLLFADQICSHLERLAMAGPVVIALDDLQWADRVSRFALRTLLSRLVGLPVVWLLASRDESVVADLVGHDPRHVDHIRLAPLARAGLAAIALDRLGQVPDERTRRFLDAAGGNPFLATQILAGLARVTPDSTPPEFTAAIAQQLSALSADARSLVELVAVAGRPLPLRDAAALTPAHRDAGARQAVAEAIESGLITAADSSLTCRHDLVREAVYAVMSGYRTRELHRAFAGYYLTVAGDPLVAASHARAAAVPGDLGAATILISAAETLAPTGPEEAGELAALAFRTLRPSQPEWPGLSRRCLTVLCHTQRTTDAIAVADQILARVDDPDLVGQIESDSAHALWLGGRITDLLARTERALSVRTLAPAVRARLRAARTLANTRLLPGDVAARETAAALEHARVADDREALALALQAAGEAARNEARHYTALEHFRELRSLIGLSHLAEEITQLQFLDRYDHARTMLAEARADSRAETETILPALHCAQLWQDFNLGRLDEAEVGARALAELGQQLGNDVHTLDAIVVRIAVALLRADVETATAQLRLADDLVDIDDGVRRPGLAVMRGWLAASSGDLTSALFTLRPVLEGAGEAYSYWPLWPCWVGLIFDIGSLAADPALAAASVEVAEISAARNPGVASFEGVALNLRGRISDDLGVVARSADVLSRSPRALLRAGGAESYGRALLAAGDRLAGLAQLDQAWDEYHWMGAEASRAHVQDTMQKAGAQRDKWSAAAAPAKGWSSLTQTEQRVAGLIGAGHTNKSAASELGVSINTIGTHLRAVFAKLGVQSRVQLANLMHEQSVG